MRQVRFPNIENVKLRADTKVWPGEMKKLKDRLPHLKRLDAKAVIESAVVGRYRA